MITDDVIRRRHALSGRPSDGPVVSALNIIRERGPPVGRVEVAVDVVSERKITVGRVTTAMGVIIKHKISPSARVATSVDIVKQGTRTGSYIGDAGRIAEERLKTIGCVEI